MDKEERVRFGVMCEKIDHIHESIKYIREHLKKLNGQVTINTAFRIRATVVISILSFISGAIMIALINRII